MFTQLSRSADEETMAQKDSDLQPYLDGLLIQVEDHASLPPIYIHCKPHLLLQDVNALVSLLLL